MAMAISREHVHNSQSNLQTYCFKKSENIHDYAPKFLVRKDFPYLNELKKVIRMAGGSGFIVKQHSNRRYRNANKYNDEIQGTNNYNFIGNQIIYFILFEALFLTVYCERSIHKKARQPNPRRFWLIAEVIIKPNKYFWVETKLFDGRLVF